MAEFTAEQVRKAANVRIVYNQEIEAFATRLDQDAITRDFPPSPAQQRIEAHAERWAHTLAQGREEGRREILMEIAKLDPIERGPITMDIYHYCGIHATDPYREPPIEHHADDCLYRRAQATTAPDTRPR